MVGTAHTTVTFHIMHCHVHQDITVRLSRHHSDKHTIAGRQNAAKTASQITSIQQSNTPSSVHVSNEKKANANATGRGRRIAALKLAFSALLKNQVLNRICIAATLNSMPHIPCYSTEGS